MGKEKSVDEPTTEAVPAITKADLDAFQANISAQLKQHGDRTDRMENRIDQGFRAAEPVKPAGPTVDEPTDEEFAAAADDPKELKKVIARANRASETRMRASFETELQARMGLGAEAISKIVNRVGGQGLKHYDKFKDAITERLNLLSPEARLDLDNIKRVHDMVAGEHYDELLEEEKQKWLADERANPGGGPTGTAGRTQDEHKVQTAKERFGDLAAENIANKGGEEAFAKKMGAKSWAEYLEWAAMPTDGGVQ